MTLIIPSHILLCIVLNDTVPGKNHINQRHNKYSATTIIRIDFFSHEFVDYFSDFLRYLFGWPLSLYILLFLPSPFHLLLLLFSYLPSLLFSFLSSLLSLPFTYHSPISTSFLLFFPLLLFVLSPDMSTPSHLHFVPTPPPSLPSFPSFLIPFQPPLPNPAY